MLHISRLMFIASCFMLAALSACQSEVDLFAYGIEAKVDLPDGVSVQKPEIGQGVVLTNQQNIHLKILPQGLNLSNYKAQVRQNQLNKLKKVHQESELLFIYESELAGQSEFHFVANQKVGANLFLCRENVVTRRFNKVDVEAMYALCKTLKAK